MGKFTFSAQLMKSLKQAPKIANANKIINNVNRFISIPPPIVYPGVLYIARQKDKKNAECER